MITVRVPATSANLGPGFDCVGLAMDLWNTFRLQTGHNVPDGIVSSAGEGADMLPKDGSNLIVRTLMNELEHLGTGSEISDKGRRISVVNRVPCNSGMGSSSTAVIAGLIFAHALAKKQVQLSEILTRAALIEGHADNVGPAIAGGMVITALIDGKVVVRPIACPLTKVVVCVPDFDFLTNDARSILPERINRADGVYNVGRALMVVEAIRTNDMKLLRRVMDDRLHEPYRLTKIPGSLNAKSNALESGALAVSLSGAGPGLLAFAAENHQAVGAAMQKGFKEAGLDARYWILNISHTGTRVDGVAVHGLPWH